MLQGNQFVMMRVLHSSNKIQKKLSF